VTTAEVHLVSVFAAAPGGGNPAPIVLNADAMRDAAMRDLAASYGHECAFVFAAAPGHDLRLRFFVPKHEMEMCGHATVGAVWLLHHLGRLPRDQVVIATLSGTVQARIIEGGVEISQPLGRVESVAAAQIADILSVLGIGFDALDVMPVVNAATSRVKTLVPLKSAAILNQLAPDFARMERLCESLGSTGLYPFAASEASPHIFEARQFPKASGYPEDPATGIAAAALAFGLLAAGRIGAGDAIVIRQGWAMGRPSEIRVRFSRDGAGCWLGGAVELLT
jgi:PhzF family phenazine biosynthesis protein